MARLFRNGTPSGVCPPLNILPANQCCMIRVFLEKARGFLADPTATFRNARDDGPGIVLPYLLALALVFAFFSALVSALMPMAGPLPAPGMAGIPLPAAVFIVAGIGVFAGSIVFGVWLHFWVAVLGGRKGIFMTAKAVVYGGTPEFLFGWIPVIGFLFTLWSLYLAVVGLNELQEISMARAILAVFIAVMLPLIMLILVASYFFIASVTTSALPVP